MKPRRTEGFTLLEILMAVSLMAVVTTVTYMAFSTMVKAWQRGVAMTDAIHHGDFVMDELSMALRSAYFPDAAGRSKSYGLHMQNDGEGEAISDVISWVKLGAALVGDDCPFAGTPHRVIFYVDDVDDAKGGRGAFVKAWRLDGQTEDFDPEEDVEPVLISRDITGFNCRTVMPENIDDDGKPEWQDEWEYTNDLAVALEITLFVRPQDGSAENSEIKRIVQIPVATLCQPWVKTGAGETVAP